MYLPVAQFDPEGRTGDPAKPCLRPWLPMMKTLRSPKPAQPAAEFSPSGTSWNALSAAALLGFTGRARDAWPDSSCRFYGVILLSHARPGDRHPYGPEPPLRAVS
jgi:hypothetical protein